MTGPVEPPADPSTAGPRRTPSSGRPPGRMPRGPFAALAASVVLLGVADSLIRAYFVLFLADDVGLSPERIGLLYSLPAVGGIALSIAMGRRFDRHPTRRWVVVSVVISAVGYALLTTTTSFVWLALISVTLLAAYHVPYPQLFSLAPVVLGAGPSGRRAVPLLRSGWSLAWAVGPLLGVVLVPAIGFTGVLWVAVGVLLLLVVTTATVPAPTTVHRPGPAREPGRRTLRADVVLLTAGVALFFLALLAGYVALPLHVTRALGLDPSLVGWMLSAGAVVEILTALAVAALPHRFPQRALVVGGALCLALHFLLVVLAAGPGLLLVSQLPRGVAIAVLTSAGLRFLQDRMSPATGFATTLFSGAADVGSLLSGVVGGVAVAVLGTRGALAGCGVVAVAAALLLAAGSARPALAPAPDERARRV